MTDVSRKGGWCSCVCCEAVLLSRNFCSCCSTCCNGYPTSLFVSPPPDQFLCAICLDVVCSPNGHTFCHSHILKAISIQGKCPMCQMRLTQSQLGKNLYVKNQVDMLEVRCPYWEHPTVSCEWTGTVSALEIHLTRSCSFHAVTPKAKPPTATENGGHSYVTNRCKICTHCGVCTGYGTNCVRCRGKDRTGDKGKDCGCGAGDSGCSACGMCRNCGTQSLCSSPSTSTCAHTYERRICMICACCGFCSEYGANCVRCRGKDRAGDKGRECGCGAGDGGCTQCGICRTCAAAGRSVTPPSGAVAAPPQIARHVGSFAGCGGNPDGFSNCRGSGNCGSGCRSCGASSHWTCCGDTNHSSVDCLPGFDRSQALHNVYAMFAARPSPTRIRDIPGVVYPPGLGSAAASPGIRTHNFITNRCKICTHCGVCTGYGTNCVRCRGKDRTGDKGKDCGCGAGDSGCSACGMCRNCGDGNAVCGQITSVCQHTFLVKRCMICTSCRCCTGYGAGCVACQGKDRTSDAGKACGCGGGDSGCSKCGVCRRCASNPGVFAAGALGAPHHSSAAGPPYRGLHPGSFSGCGGNPTGKGNCKGAGNCGTFCDSCGAHTHWSCCGSTDPNSTHCLSHISPAQAIINKDAMFAEHVTPLLVSRIPGVEYGCAHPGSFPGCGGNPDGISNCRGGGNCGSNCSNCGARTHWSCCGSTNASSTHCPPHIAPGQAVKNKDIVFAMHSTPIRIRAIPGVNYGSGSAHNYVVDKCKICIQCGVCTGYGGNCCECRGKDRSGDRGKLCGCGGGSSGCSNCGKCESCGGIGNTCTGGHSSHAPVPYNPNSGYSSAGAAFPPPLPSQPISPVAIPALPPGLPLRRPPPVAADEWLYRDDQENTQGPYSGASMRQWCEGGYFTRGLPIRMTEWVSFHPLSTVFPDMDTAFTYSCGEPHIPP